MTHSEKVLDELFKVSWTQAGKGPRPYWDSVKEEIARLRGVEKEHSALQKENATLKATIKLVS